MLLVPAANIEQTGKAMLTENYGDVFKVGHIVHLPNTELPSWIFMWPHKQYMRFYTFPDLLNFHSVKHFALNEQIEAMI